MGRGGQRCSGNGISVTRSSSSVSAVPAVAAELRELELMMGECGVAIDHSTIARWVLRYAPVLNERIRSEMRRPNRSWRCDETYIRVAGKWTYLYRAIDLAGNTTDFLLSPRRDVIAAEAFLELALGQPAMFNHA
jgi:transposase-like protein